MGNLSLYVKHARNRPRRPRTPQGGPAVDPAAEIAGLSGPERELYEERAAIMEIDGGLSRQAAERAALNAILAGRE